LVLAATGHVAGGLLRGQGLSTSSLSYVVPGWIALIIPFVVFAGGVTTTPSRASTVVGRAALLAILSYGLMAFVTPIAKYRARAASGVDVETLYPFGPETPGGYLRHRAAVQNEPPDQFSYRIDRPRSLPPNWLSYLIYSPIAFALFTIFSAMLGREAAFFTTGLSPPVRRDTRWTLGLVSGAAFFVAEAIGGDWVRGDPSRSAMLGAGLPLLIPAAGLLISQVLHAVRRHGLRV